MSRFAAELDGDTGVCLSFSDVASDGAGDLLGTGAAAMVCVRFAVSQAGSPKDMRDVKDES